MEVEIKGSVGAQWDIRTNSGEKRVELREPSRKHKVSDVYAAEHSGIYTEPWKLQYSS